MKYLEEVDKGMQLLADNRDTVVVGQAVNYKGHALTRQAQFWGDDRRIEVPVAEDFQTGFALGMALTNVIPVSLYPRCNFLLCGANQFVNHLDKWSKMGGGNPHVILVAAIGSENPLDPGHQHKANYSHEFKSMCPNVNVAELIYPYKVLPAFEKAINEPGVHLIVTHGDLL